MAERRQELLAAIRSHPVTIICTKPLKFGPFGGQILKAFCIIKEKPLKFGPFGGQILKAFGITKQKPLKFGPFGGQILKAFGIIKERKRLDSRGSMLGCLRVLLIGLESHWGKTAIIQ